MYVSIVIMTLSSAMFVYWFRYSCALILESDWNEEQARGVATKHELKFQTVENQLAGAISRREMNTVRDLLDRDMRRLAELMAHSPAIMEAGQSLESRMLMVDYQLMKVWYALTRCFAPPAAEVTLRKMTRIVAYMAGEFGDQLSTARV